MRYKGKVHILLNEVFECNEALKKEGAYFHVSISPVDMAFYLFDNNFKIVYSFEYWFKEHWKMDNSEKTYEETLEILNTIKEAME